MERPVEQRRRKERRDRRQGSPPRQGYAAAARNKSQTLPPRIETGYRNCFGQTSPPGDLGQSGEAREIPRLSYNMPARHRQQMGPKEEAVQIARLFDRRGALGRPATTSRRHHAAYD